MHHPVLEFRIHPQLLLLIILLVGVLRRLRSNLIVYLGFKLLILTICIVVRLAVLLAQLVDIMRVLFNEVAYHFIFNEHSKVGRNKDEFAISIDDHLDLVNEILSVLVYAETPLPLILQHQKGNSFALLQAEVIKIIQLHFINIRNDLRLD